jgi:2-polyprenyl-3-methyl-5-hydroxy-6-metoxy-1,4-benzoquinol methylase/uncharacterized protein YbaR (Trm112 family)
MNDTEEQVLDPWFEQELVCPRDKSDIRNQGTELVCSNAHRYPIVQGVPVMLFVDENVTMPKAFARSLALAGEEKRSQGEVSNGNYNRAVDPWVQEHITDTCGRRLFGRALGNLSQYPIPDIPLPPPAHAGQELLDIGCNWGRWSVSAARMGYVPIGIDPMLEAVQAAQRITNQLGLKARFVVGDARYLPFRNERFEVVHSYGVFQHFSKDNARLAIAEAGRVLAPNGSSLIQMTGAFGLLALWRLVAYPFRLGFNDVGEFKVRHWTPAEIRSFFGRSIGPTTVSVDGFFTIMPQPGDLKLLALRHRAIIRLSELGRALSRVFPPLVPLADSLYATSRKAG